MKILITGGHATPALAVIDELQSHASSVEIIWVGRKTSYETDAHASEEERLVTAYDIPFVPLTTGRMATTRSLRSILSFAKIPIGCIHALMLVRRYNPDIILSFGGYIGFPVVLAGALLGIPSIVHEQTRVPGLSNRMASRFATRVCISERSSATAFGSRDVVYTGLPIRKAIFDPPRVKPFPLQTDKPLLYIAGGSGGSTSLNAIVYHALPNLLDRYSVVHQVGRGNMKRAKREQSNLSTKRAARYEAVPYLDVRDLAWVYKHATLVIGRSGANTVAEVAATGGNALWIPLPWARGNEQAHNAQILVDAGTSRIVQQQGLTDKRLLQEIDTMMKDKKTLEKNAQAHKKTISDNAAAHVVAQIVDVYESTRSAS